MHSFMTLAISISISLVLGREVVPLANKRFKYPDGIPYRVDTDENQPRGDQLGYNICNSTTEGQSSLCQTAIFNSLDDFCIWAPPSSNHTVGEIEGEMVAWCTKPGHGTRVIPPGALTGVQLTRTPDYVQVVGFIDQTKINMLPGDAGGEMDPHGADGRGNPIGGVLFSDAFSGKYEQVVEWHSFMGSNKFCLKACDQTRPNAQRYCEHIFDRIGCDYNAPSNARDGVFESCASDSQDFPGVYTDGSGTTQTYTQPPESAGEVATLPYAPRVPASSSCSQFRSAEIYATRGASVPVPVPIQPAAATHAPTFTPTPTHTPSAYSSSPSSRAPAHTATAAFGAAINPPLNPSPFYSTTSRYSSFVANTGIIPGPDARPIFLPTYTPHTQLPTSTSGTGSSIPQAPVSFYSPSSTTPSQTSAYTTASISATITSTTLPPVNSTHVASTTASSSAFRADNAAALASGLAEGSAVTIMKGTLLNILGAFCVVMLLGYFTL